MKYLKFVEETLPTQAGFFLEKEVPNSQKGKGQMYRKPCNQIIIQHYCVLNNFYLLPHSHYF